jgi:drug/metabolite transporter (DMT)-like permease
VGSPLDTIFGLPTHVLIVHATVVFLPLAVLGAVVIVVKRNLIHRLGALTVIIAAIGAGAAWVSRGSGEQLASRVGFPEPHVEYGDALPLHATAFFVVVLVYWLVARGIPGNRSRPWWVMVIGVVVIIGGVGLLWSTIITGHSGAEATWGAIIENTRPGQIPAQ